MKSYLFLLILLIHFSLAKAQDSDTSDIAKNTIYIDFIGPGAHSFNYDRVFYRANNIKLSFRVGFSLFSFITGFKLNGVPLLINGYWGKKNHHVQLGIGASTFWGTFTTNLTDTLKFRVVPYAALFLGYRFQKPNGGFFFQAGYTPWVENFKEFQHLGGIGIGYTFKRKK